MHRQRQLSHLLLGIVGMSVLAWFLNMVSPTSWQMIAVFFALMSFTVFFLSLYLWRHTRRAVLITLGLLVYLLLRLIGLTSLLYPVLLIASLVSLEWIAARR